ncbi:hypothetical protein ACIRO3_35345 [Streptomyces sp. NPDC102278]|uniref:hypothetical protein n=1 Tax=Streptomyces sp. NPDC102278 TaxID=3366152 RepID=UPI00380DE0F4
MWMGFDKKEAKATVEGAIPWLAPTGKLTVEALRKLDRPLLAWAPEGEAYRFESAAYYSEYADEPGGLSPLEKKVAALPPRPEWTMERIWTPDEESSEEQHTAYHKASVTIGGRLLHPRDLDSYAAFAYEYAGLDDEDADDDLDDEDGQGQPRVTGDLEAALAWAAAGVCVLQQSLPHPFRDVLRYADTDNRPAHRVLFAYAQLLRIKDPAKAAPWFTALVYLNPTDNLGARFCAPGGPSDRLPEPV